MSATTEKATVVGALLGGLVGLLFPLAGMAIGAAAGAAVGAATDTGVRRSFVDEVKTTLRPGRSALFLVVTRSEAALHAHTSPPPPAPPPALRPPHQRFPDLRHAFATLPIESGEDLAVVSRILGHADFSTTADVYAHLTPAMLDRTAARMDEALGVNASL